MHLFFNLRNFTPPDFESDITMIITNFVKLIDVAKTLV